MVRRVIPYEILRNASAITLDLIERIVTEDEQIAMRSFLRHEVTVLDDIIQAIILIFMIDAVLAKWIPQKPRPAHICKLYRKQEESFNRKF